jgi:hypothetical protein
MAKRDSRADPTSMAPADGAALFVDHVTVSNDTKAASEVAFPDSAVVLATGKVTSQDPRYEALETMLDANDWRAVGIRLGPLVEVGKLPPNFGLLAALAHNETSLEGSPEAAAIAVRCMAGILGVDENSALARVLARRILRKNPVRMRGLKAPPPRTSLLIVLVTLVVGGGVGWLASLGSWRAVLHWLHLR